MSCHVMSYAGEGNTSFRSALVAAGACDVVARSLMRFSALEAVAWECCRALVALLVESTNTRAGSTGMRGSSAIEVQKSRLGSIGVCAFVVESLLLFPFSAQVAKWGSRCVAVLAECHEANAFKLGDQILSITVIPPTLLYCTLLGATPLSHPTLYSSPLLLPDVVMPSRANAFMS